jgi:hypothetical protein
VTNPMFELPEGEPRQPARRPPSFAGTAEQFIYLTSGPRLSWPGWEDTLERHNHEITLRRLAHAREIFEEEMCTEFEAMLYVSTASLAHPLSHDWVAIYGWLFSRWNPEASQEIWGQARELDPNQLEELNRLRRWIFHRQMNHLKASRREASQKEVEEEEQRLEAQQPRMFEIPEEGE